MSDRMARELGRRRTARAHRVLDMFEGLAVRNASDTECEGVLDGMAAVARPDTDPISLDSALDSLEALAARVARRRWPWKSRRKWRTDVSTVTREGQPVGRTEPSERLRKDLVAAPEPAVPTDNVLPFRARGGRPRTGREWVSERTRGEAASRGLEDEEF